MSKKFKVLLPVDLSKKSLSAFDFAVELAKQNDGSLILLYVAPPTLPQEALYGPEMSKRYIEEAMKKFNELQIEDPGVEIEKRFLHGNPGPTIVQVTREADLCVMSTHGRNAVMRLVMGSVAQYVLRNAKCPVVLTKGLDGFCSDEEPVVQAKYFVSEVMHQVAPVHRDDAMTDVLEQLEKANETAAAVVDVRNRCIGILTTSDIEKYQSLKVRHDAGDRTVIKEMFETNKYGLVRCGNADFDQVCRHMTEDVVSVWASDSIEDAIEKFAEHPSIHHLVVVDQDNHPVGIINATSIEGLNSNLTDQNPTTDAAAAVTSDES